MENGNIIMFIDDEKHILSSLHRSLHKWLKKIGLEIVTADSAHQAISFIHSRGNDIAVIISDQRMPDLKGSELSKIIFRKFPDISVIILSGHSDISDMKDIIKSGVFAFIQKPWDTEILKTEIQKSYEMFKLKKENRLNQQRMEKDLALAADFQRSFLHIPSVDSANVKVDITYLPYSNTGVSGDYYDFYELDDKHCVILIGDVADKGMKAAFMTSVIKSIVYPEYISRAENSPFSPSHFLSWLNNRMCGFLEKYPDIFISFTAVLLDLEKNVMKIANAGHTPTYLMRQGSLLFNDSMGLALGYEKNVSYDLIDMEIQSGDEIIMYTDGLAPSGNKLDDYNNTDLYFVLENNAGHLHDHEKIMSGIRKIANLEQWSDDVTLITIGILP